MRRMLRRQLDAQSVPAARMLRMAPFRTGHDELQHPLPWRLMQNGPVTKYWRPECFEQDLAALVALEFHVVRFDVASWGDELAMGDALRDGLALPSYTGRSFDALADSLTDVEVSDEGGVVVALDNFTETERFETLLRVLAEASRWWLLFGRLFIVLLRTDDPDYTGPTNLGATAANWNNHEWLAAKRKP
jgi:hypothetical protein